MNNYEVIIELLEQVERLKIENAELRECLEKCEQYLDDVNQYGRLLEDVRMILDKASD